MQLLAEWLGERGRDIRRPRGTLPPLAARQLSSAPNAPFCAEAIGKRANRKLLSLVHLSTD
jgi:hypothetical protein